MNWEAISAVSEIIGAIAVVVSLIYLAIQIRQNTRQIINSIDATRLAAFERNSESGNRTREFFLTNPDLADVYRAGCRSYVSLSKTDKINFGLMVRNVFSSVQGGYVRQLTLGHDPGGFEGISLIVDEIIAAPGIREYLETHRLDWRKEFREFVDKRLKTKASIS